MTRKADVSNYSALAATARGLWLLIPFAHNVPTSSVMPARQVHLRTPQEKGSDLSLGPNSRVHAL